jgi:hypothetical protein
VREAVGVVRDNPQALALIFFVQCIYRELGTGETGNKAEILFMSRLAK